MSRSRVTAEIIVIGALAGALLASGCVAGADEPAPAGDPAALRGDDCGEAICRREHAVEVDDGIELYVVEAWSPRASRGRPRRAVLMLPATLVTNVIWNADVDAGSDYDALARAAEQGFHAYTFDWYGYGRSDAPADGREVTAEVMLEHAGELLEWIRRRQRVPHVDLIGASAGSAIAVALGGRDGPVPRGHVGRIVLTAHVHESASALANALIFNDDVRGLLAGAPAGYVETGPMQYGLILASATPEARAYCLASCPGTYAVGPTLEGFDLPVFRAEQGRARALQLWGTADLISTREDAEEFQRDYGGRSELVVLDGGGHVPHWEAVRDRFWEETFAFLR